MSFGGFSVFFSDFSLELLEDLFFTLELLEDLELLFALLLELLKISASSLESPAELPESSPQETRIKERRNERMAKFFMVYSFPKFHLLLNLLKYLR
ncbi:hypothetical protein [Fibrobacter sp.]|uniref:hypothetical protein n=1 Tax=Fibrobacter sp. TaxID=35828 RepID=UPI0025B99FE1|nr:hypothetical protein [Fibrobacter sp.]MBR3071549.1 hypothetical protein [Fibrobacter sp.]